MTLPTPATGKLIQYWIGAERCDLSEIRENVVDKNAEILKQLQEKNASEAPQAPSNATTAVEGAAASPSPSSATPSTAASPATTAVPIPAASVAAAPPPGVTPTTKGPSEATPAPPSTAGRGASKGDATLSSGPLTSSSASSSVGAAQKATSSTPLGSSPSSSRTPDPPTVASTAASSSAASSSPSPKTTTSGKSTSSFVSPPSATSAASKGATTTSSPQKGGATPKVDGAASSGSWRDYWPSKKVVWIGVVVAGAALVGYGAYRYLQRRRQKHLVNALSVAMSDEDKCHLFILPRCRLSPSETPSCTEAETFLRVARIAYVVHFVSNGADLSVALKDLPSSVLPRTVIRAHGGIGRVGGSVETPRRSLQRRRSSDPSLEDKLYEGRLAKSRKTVEGYDHNLPLLVYGPSGVFIGCQAIYDFAMDSLRVRLDLNFTKEEALLGKHVQDRSRFSLSQYVARTLWDHPRFAALCIGVKRDLPFPELTGYFFLLSDAMVRYNKSTPIGEMTREEYEQRFLEEVRLLEETIGNKAFLVGFQPSSYDCAIYAALLPLFSLQKVGLQFPGEALPLLLGSTKIKEYMRRITEIAFPDLEDLLAVPVEVGETETYDYKRITS